MTDQPQETGMVVFGAENLSPTAVIGQATVYAKQLAALINDRKLYSVISDRKYVRVEGWMTLGAMMGIIAREVSVTEGENGDYEAVVELVRTRDGTVIGRASALCGADERTWGKRDRYARRSMATTRATGKAFRLAFSWIIALAGYEATPAEEMPIEGEAHDAPEPPPARKSLLYPENLDGTTPPPATERRIWTPREIDAVAFETGIPVAKHNIAILNLSPFTPGDNLEDINKWTRLYLFNRWSDSAHKIARCEPPEAAKQATAAWKAQPAA